MPTTWFGWVCFGIFLLWLACVVIAVWVAIRAKIWRDP